MLSFLPPLLRGVLAFVLLALNTLGWCTLLFALSPLKLLRQPALRARVDALLNGIANRWVTWNSGWMRLTQRTTWDVQGTAELQRDGWYLVNCNHQTWVDIFVLQRVLNARIPLLKFFLKQQLIYVPVIGLAWWALDFPFMRRHSKAALREHPELRLQDRETARRACEKFARVPTSVMNFAEGTRFTPAKHAAQGSPYRHLLKPKAGALAMALDAMGARFHSMIDATIVYPDGVPTFWQFLCGRCPRIVVRLRQLEIPAAFCTSDYAADAAFRREFHRWLSGLWADKDASIGALLSPAASPPTRA